MEDILAIVLVLATVAVIVLSIRWIQRKRAEIKEREYREMQEQIEATRKWRLARREAAREKTLSYAAANTKAVPPAKPSYAPSPTQSVAEYQDNLVSDVALAVALHSISNTQVSHPSPTIKSNESSWGFDDPDSRRSASSSFSSSDNSSSYSSSSSDSGPSSDW